MREYEFLQYWHSEKTMYTAWAEYIVDHITSVLINDKNKNLGKYLKIPVVPREKEDDSLIDKAFYRGKNYQNPYEDIEDKVGIRFVMMLESEINDICEIIQDANIGGRWSAVKCRDFLEERRANPTVFTYQSQHFVIRSRKNFLYNNIEIKEGTPCEVQIRSLLQHAYAELTHEVTYKKKTIVDPDVGRTIAKTMAFIETADVFFKNVTDLTSNNELISLEKKLDQHFISITKKQPIRMKSAICIYDTFSDLINERTINKIDLFVNKNPEVMGLISEKQKDNIFYNQSVIIFVYWLITKRQMTLERDWPLNWRIISDIAIDLGISLERKT